MKRKTREELDKEWEEFRQWAIANVKPSHYGNDPDYIDRQLDGLPLQPAAPKHECQVFRLSDYRAADSKKGK